MATRAELCEEWAASSLESAEYWSRAARVWRRYAGYLRTTGQEQAAVDIEKEADECLKAAAARTLEAAHWQQRIQLLSFM